MSDVTQIQLRAVLDLLMCSDPWPVNDPENQRAVEEFVDAGGEEVMEEYSRELRSTRFRLTNFRILTKPDYWGRGGNLSSKLWADIVDLREDTDALGRKDTRERFVCSVCLGYAHDEEGEETVLESVPNDD